ncbi:DUF262 domain-containing protein [Devosia chinhatensis]|uniref:DUF262 domain-containing protein n=1 Tax=Devosia chinhatensis TaxID=429727 RepID=A0A0F5FIZ1_9HYPH|nr:DUF262 domain-containing protein [Devosia chinhatensis]KKB08816.1 hypothetical protein VE26_01730 [Devosia chinhatensis]
MPISIGANTVGGIFATNCFRVPHYQRAYAWESDPQLQDFLNDLVSHPTSASRPYYLGTVLLTRSESQPYARLTQYDVVDGQQRLTTISIFTRCLLDRLSKNPEQTETVTEFTYGLLFSMGKLRLFRTVEEDDAFFERFVTGDDHATDSDCNSPSQHRLTSAKRFFDHQLEQFSDARLVELLNTLFNSTILIYAVDSPIEATQIFEFQNDRGKRLTNLEALKSFLMHGLYLHSDENTENNLRYVQQQFARLYRTAEAIEGEPLAPGEDQLLGYYCAAYLPPVFFGDEEGWRKPKELVRHLLQTPKYLKNGDRSELIKRFSAELADAFGDALQILRSRAGANPVASLSVLGRTAIFWPLLIKTWRHSQLHRPSEFSRVTAEMERFASASSLAGVRADTGESAVRRLANEFSGNLDAVIAELVAMRAKHRIPDRVLATIDDREFYQLGRTARYVLWKYENHLRSLPGCREQLLSWKELVQSSNTAEQYGVDHITPQDSSDAMLDAMTRWDPTSLDEVEGPFRDVFLHRLGNLVLDTRSTGAAKGKKSFSDRVANYSKSTFVSQNELLTKYASKSVDGDLLWDADSIRTRHKDLKQFITQHL